MHKIEFTLAVNTIGMSDFILQNNILFFRI